MGTIVTTATRDLQTLCQETNTTFVLALFVDLTGKPCAKLVPTAAVGELSTDGVGFAGYAVGAMGQTPKDPDLVAIPDPASFTPIPFVKPGLALVHCDPHVLGKPWPFAPRNILKAVLRQCADAGFEAWVGAEVEYFLLTRNADGTLATADAADTAAQPCYDARSVTRMFDHLAAISDAMNGLGWGNFAYADALTTADRVITLRYLLSMLADERGMIATFMPKPFGDRTGTGLHLHMSLTSAEQPVFATASDEEDTKGLGLSATAYAFIGGILDHAAALQAIIAPTVNSYKRTGALSTTSGASWAPRTPTYGGNDRTHYIRVPDDQRIELRGGDGSANPYLAVAAALGAGLDGVKRSSDPGTAATLDPNRPAFPLTLLHAIDHLDADPVIKAVLDSASPITDEAAPSAVSTYYANLKRDEFFAWHSAVTPWEIDTYLTAF